MTEVSAEEIIDTLNAGLLSDVGRYELEIAVLKNRVNQRDAVIAGLRKQVSTLEGFIQNPNGEVHEEGVGVPLQA